MLTRRTLLNLVAVGVASAALIVYGVTQLVVAELASDRYPLFVELPVAGGLLENKEVTYNGHPVGVVEDVVLVGEGVRVELAIDRDQRVPRQLDVVVLRRSAIGEQALDFRPLAPVDEDTAFYDPGDMVTPRELTLPPETDDVLRAALRVLEPVDTDRAGALVAELADAVRGRRDDLRAILDESATLSDAVADAGGDYERLFASARVVNAELAEHRDTLARLIDEMSAATSILTESRADFEALLADAPPALSLASGLLERSQADLSCDIRYLANLSDYMAQPQVLDDAAEALRLNRFFFEGFDSFTVRDDFGHAWQRLLFIAPHGPPAESYLPEKRPIPDVLPGGACSSPFGEGAPAATQPGYAPRVPDAEVIPPLDDRAVATRVADPRQDAARASHGRPSSATADPLPATGGDSLPALLGAGLLIGATRLARRPAKDQ